MPAVIESAGTTASDLATLVDQVNETNIKGPVTHITVLRHNPITGNYKTMGSVGVDVCNESYVQRRFKGGTYRFMLKNQKGIFLNSISNIEIAEPDAEMMAEFEGEDQPDVPRLPAVVPHTTEVELLRSALDKSHELMREMIHSFSANAGGGGGGGQLKDLVSAIAALQQLQPARPAGIEELVPKMFGQAFDLASKLAGNRAPGEPQSEWIGLARDVFKEAMPLLRQVPAAPRVRRPAENPPASTAAAAEVKEAEVVQEGEGEEMETDLTEAVQFVKAQLASGSSSSFLIELTLNSMRGNDEFTEVIEGAVEIPIEEIIALDAELQAEPLKTKFSEFFEGLRARILADGSGGRP